MISRVIKRMSNKEKIIYSFLILLFTLLLIVGIPSLAKYKNNNSLITTTAWDGSIATAYNSGDGTINTPYIISTAAELAYFSEQLETNNYLNNYFKITNDIKLNEGILSYDETDGIKYILNSTTYYVDEYTNNYYDTLEKDGEIIGTINLFNGLNNFKGTLDGDNHTINGLYITSFTENELALFTSLNGNISNLYVTDAVIYGGIYTGGISSTSNDSTIKNVLFDGFVVGRSTNLDNSLNIDINIPTITTFNTENISITNNIPLYSSVITSTTITGNCVITGDATVKINNNVITNGSFNINLGTTLLDELTITTSKNTANDVSVTFTNVSYNVVYNYSVSAGIIANSKNTTVINAINKGTIISEYVAGGIIGITNDLNTVSNTYNNGIINGLTMSGGIIGLIDNNTSTSSLTKSYNISNIIETNSGGLVGAIINTTNLSITNVFDDSLTTDVINLTNNSTLTISNAYYTNTVGNLNISSDFNATTTANLKDETFLKNNLSLNKFISLEDLETNSDNVWTFISNEYPILFIDDIMSININSYSWNDLKYEVNNYDIDNSITFNIEALSGLNIEKDIYYYLDTTGIPLTNTELLNITSWSTYSNSVQIGLTGRYIIYAKIVEDTDITYINTDLITLDLTGPVINITYEDTTWNTISNNPTNIYLDREGNISVSANDLYNEVESTKYYISSSVIDITSINDSSFTTYIGEISINKIGNNIVYVKSVDTKGNVSYANSGMLVYNGYKVDSLTIGKDSSSYNVSTYNITDKSTISINTSYTSTSNSLSNITHNIISNILLPINTKVIIVDNVNHKAYEFTVSTSEDIYGYNSSCNESTPCTRLATYPFTLFKEIGTHNSDKYFTESDYITNGNVNENFTITLDFSNTAIVSNYLSVSYYMELHDSNNKTIRPTLYSEIKSFNILKEVGSSNTYASLDLSTDSNINTINLNSNGTTNININSRLIYKTYYANSIIDTKYENMYMGLLVKLLDSNGNIVSKDYLKNIRFKIGTSEYYPNDDNLIRINLSNGIVDTTKTLSIIISEDNNALPIGNYYFKITNYVSYDGEYYDNLNTTQITIPAVISNNSYRNNYSFNVIVNDTDRILNKDDATKEITLNLIQKGLSNPNIKISLYQKTSLTAYNQDYTLVDLQDYVSDTLNEYETSLYNAITNPLEYDGTINTYNPFTLNLIMDDFNYGGYKFVFDLYDGTRKIGTIEKKFIVK